MSTSDTQYITLGVKDVYLGTPILKYKYACIILSIIAQIIISWYNLIALIYNMFIDVKT